MLNPGGGCNSIYRYACMLRTKYQFDWMACSLTGNDWAYKFEDLGGTVKMFPGMHGLRRFIQDLPTFRSYISFIKKNHYKIIHVNTGSTGVIRFLFCGFLGGAPKRIIHAHSTGQIGKNESLRIKINKWLMSLFATDYIACSKEAAEALFPKKGVDKAVILYNGLDTDVFRFDGQKREEIRNCYHLSDAHYVIGHIGRFAREKNHCFLLDAFSKLIKTHAKPRLMLLGSGPLEDDIRKTISRLRLDDYVIWVGQVDNVQDYMNAMDVMALPSLYEGLGMVNIEAQTNGLPCVVSDGVAKLAKVTDLLTFYSLSDGPEKWAEYLLDRKDMHVDRVAYAEIVRRAGWDIRDLAGKLAEIYER